MPRQVLRWPVPVDDLAHPIGNGPIMHVAAREHAVVEVWTEEDGNPELTRFVQVFGTGHLLPDDATHVGSTFDGGTTGLVWHVYEYAHGGDH